MNISIPQEVTLIGVVTFLLMVATYAVYNLVLRKDSPDMAKVTTERMKLLLDEYKATTKEKSDLISDLQLDFQKVIDENEELKSRINRIKTSLINDSKVIEILSNYFAMWIIKMPSGLMQWVSNLYESYFLTPQNLSKEDYIFAHNKSIWGKEIASEYDLNNTHSIENGIWLGFQTIVVNGLDVSNNYLVVKIGDKGKGMGVGFAIKMEKLEKKKELHKMLILAIHAIDEIITT